MASSCPFLLEQLETGETTEVVLSEKHDKSKPRHTVGCTPYECHGSMMEKNGFGAIENSYDPSVSQKMQEADDFLKQYADETNKYTPFELSKRLHEVKKDISDTGTYTQTFDELEFGCRLAWRNSGRCTMRKVAFTLELRDCRHVKTAESCFQEIVKHLVYCQNGGALKPVISVFAPKENGKSAPVRVWNRQLLGYAAYQCQDGTIMGDPVNLSFTALCVQFGWKPPAEKSDFDFLPLLISDKRTGLDRPRVFVIPPEAILEVAIEHPEHELFSALNMRWYAIPAISDIGIDVGGVYYQTSPFNGWYAITEISRDLLDKQRYDMTEAVAIACDIPRETLSVWRDDAQLQVHRAILHSFAKQSISVVDHHTASEAFLDFYSDEIKARKKCPADWVWLVPPAGGSMTGVFHQEMLNFIVKPQYRLQVAMSKEEGITLPPPITVPISRSSSEYEFHDEVSIYKTFLVCYGTETGTSLRYATKLAAVFGDHCAGAIPLNDLPSLLREPMAEKTLVLVVASTFGKGNPPNTASTFLSQMEQIESGTVKNCDFGVFALGNSAYQDTFVLFGYSTHSALKRAGCSEACTVQVADELKNQEAAYADFQKLLLDTEEGIVYKAKRVAGSSDRTSQKLDSGIQKVPIRFIKSEHIILSGVEDELKLAWTEEHQETWASYAHKMCPSIDLFSFEIDLLSLRNNVKSLRPGDHIALYPSNLDDTSDLVSRLIKLDNTIDIGALKDFLKNQVVLAKPLEQEQLVALSQIIENEQAKVILKYLLEKISKDTVTPSLERLVNMLPPGSIPVQWVLENPATISPRFYSITSFSLSERTVSICQSVLSFPPPVDRAGLTSRWLRSLKAGDEAMAVVSNTDFHLPQDESDPVIFIGTGSGVAPFRSFWLSGARNPMYLFYGCRTKDDLPFSSEIGKLKLRGRMTPFIAYSRGSERMYVSDMIMKEAGTLLPLLHNTKSHIFLCGSPQVEEGVNNALMTVLATGNSKYHGLGVVRSIERLVIMKQQKRYKTEVYGKSSKTGPLSMLWSEATARVTRITSGLEGSKVLRRPSVEAPKGKKGVGRLKSFRPEVSISPPAPTVVPEIRAPRRQTSEGLDQISPEMARSRDAPERRGVKSTKKLSRVEEK